MPPLWLRAGGDQCQEAAKIADILEKEKEREIEERSLGVSELSGSIMNRASRRSERKELIP